MAVGKGFFDQYSVFCVFGSVVGCVVVPLITQVSPRDKSCPGPCRVGECHTVFCFVFIISPLSKRF